MVILLGFISLCANDFNDMDYAMHLMRQRDYERSISELKRISFFSTDLEVKQLCFEEIARCYYYNGQHREALSHLMSAPSDSLTYSQALFNKLWMGLNYYKLSSFSDAYTQFVFAAHTEPYGIADLYIVLLQAETGNFQEAISIASRLQKYSEHPLIIETISEVLPSLKSAQNVRPLNPYLATTFSSILPGSGQLYAGHFYDGIMAFLYVGSFTYAGWMTYNYEKDRGKGYYNTAALLSVDALFYLGNLVGAYRTTQYRNMMMRQQVIDPVKRRVLSHPLP